MRTALDGTEYNLLLLDSEGIDAYDQTVRRDSYTFSKKSYHLNTWVDISVTVQHIALYSALISLNL